ncbi:AMP-binding protein [Nocardioides sp. B-3]|uniref:AMP-binding protein n=1 Tax=Nocardioides sp. B-3 TaxID=2895565 RepID=UPI00215298B2|nr:AMP-binding protein [Nocardioides sp. B-3]
MATLAGQLARSSHAYPTKSALVFGETERTYRQLDEEVNQYAHALAALGVTKGDRVALMSGNSDVFVIAMYATFRLGAVFVPLNPRATSHELRHLLTDSGASVLLLGAGMMPVVEGLADHDPIAPAPQMLGLDASTGLPSLPEKAAGQPTTAPNVVVAEDDDCMILYTSGTTGLAKGALFDHHRLLWVGHSVASLGTTGADRHLHVAPLYHCAQLVLLLLNGMSVGASHVILPGFRTHRRGRRHRTAPGSPCSSACPPCTS